MICGRPYTRQRVAADTGVSVTARRRLAALIKPHYGKISAITRTISSLGAKVN
jgi:hypothetical protein